MPTTTEVGCNRYGSIIEECPDIFLASLREMDVNISFFLDGRALFFCVKFPFGDVFHAVFGKVVRPWCTNWAIASAWPSFARSRLPSSSKIYMLRVRVNFECIWWAIRVASTGERSSMFQRLFSAKWLFWRLFLMLVGRTSCHKKAYLRCKFRICVRFVAPSRSKLLSGDAAVCSVSAKSCCLRDIRFSVGQCFV